MEVKVCVWKVERDFFFPFLLCSSSFGPLLSSLLNSHHSISVSKPPPKKEPKGLSPPLYVEESSDKEAGTSAKENQDAYQRLFEMCALILLIAGDNGYPCVLRLPFHAGYHDGWKQSLPHRFMSFMRSDFFSVRWWRKPFHIHPYMSLQITIACFHRQGLD